MRAARRRAVGRALLATCAAVAGWLASAPSANAHFAALIVVDAAGTVDPAAGVPRIFALTGIASSATNVWLKYRPATSAPCAVSAELDGGIELPQQWDADTYGRAVSGPFDVRTTFTWESSSSGAYRFCIWLASDAATAVTPIEQLITFRPPTGSVTLGVTPATPVAGEPAELVYRGASEAPAELYSRLQRADQGTCGPTYLAGAGDVLVSGADVAGPFAIAGDVAFTHAGAYVVCSWVARSAGDVRPIAGPIATPLTVVAAPRPCVVPRVTLGIRAAAMKRRLRSAGCTPGRVRYVRSLRVPRRAVVRLGRRAGTRLAPAARVTIYVSLGRPRARR